MSILHLVRSSAFSHDDLSQCIKNIESEDIIVLLDDGCYNLKHPLMAELITQHPKVDLYIIKEHAKARAINIDDALLNEAFDSITMTDLVSLTFSNNSVVTWQ